MGVAEADQAMNWGKCIKLHAQQGHGVDGCQLFDGENPGDVLCGACGCHMSYHVKLNLGSRYGYEVVDLEPGLKRCKMSFEASPAESVGDNLDSLGLEVDSGTSHENLIGVFRVAKVVAPVTVKPEPRADNTLLTDSPLYIRLCTKLKLIQKHYPEEIHGKFSIVHDEEHGFRVYCGGCDKRYGITKPGYSLGNFERGHLASKRHKDGGGGRVKMKNFLQQAELAKRAAKTMYCG